MNSISIQPSMVMESSTWPMNCCICSEACSRYCRKQLAHAGEEGHVERAEAAQRDTPDDDGADPAAQLLPRQQPPVSGPAHGRVPAGPRLAAASLALFVVVAQEHLIQAGVFHAEVEQGVAGGELDDGVDTVSHPHPDVVPCWYDVSDAGQGGEGRGVDGSGEDESHLLAPPLQERFRGLERGQTAASYYSHPVAHPLHLARVCATRGRPSCPRPAPRGPVWRKVSCTKRIETGGRLVEDGEGRPWNRACTRPDLLPVAAAQSSCRAGRGRRPDAQRACRPCRDRACRADGRSSSPAGARSSAGPTRTRPGRYPTDLRTSTLCR